ncbi:MAG: helix-turn-helix domain-containing protein [Ruminococcus sp.]|nr:helix-turn-helix domain-containing protein [Ruminococcus sp.]MCD8188412.1 helix-turn-helix domain-containing protein [Ruminococcus sp.]
MGEMLIGDKIREARKKAGLTQWQLAEKVFVSESYIALIESNKRNPSMSVLTKLAEVLNITTDHIVFDTSSRNTDSFTLEWQKLIENRTPEEIESALKIVKTYFECIDEL